MPSWTQQRTDAKVDRDGTGSTSSFTQIATLQGVTGLTDEAALETVVSGSDPVAGPATGRLLAA